MDTMGDRSTSARARRRWGVRLAALVVLGAVAATGATVKGGGGAALAAPATTSGVAAAAQGGKVEAEVYADLAAGKGEATFFVLLAEKADLSAASGIAGRADRGRHVMEQLTGTAERSQAPLRQFLRTRNVHFEPFWIVNAIQVTGDLELVGELTARPDVRLVFAEKEYRLPDPAPASDVPRIGAVEWGIDRINAPAVWAQGISGAGIVVGSIDTGAQFNHPAIVGQYRGNLGGGSFDHNYNWHDPSAVCGTPSLVPCDNNGHGTHVTGTMVGDDGGTNQIGVAPGAKWIAAKGCESTSCSTSALLSSGQWMLAPTQLNGSNPDPSKRPHIVNNSWGGGATNDTWYQATVQAWVAAGMFPQFANGNSGPSCGTAGNPGNTPEAYASGSFDVNNVIANNSSRGPSAFGGIIKPNIAAPGVAVRSSIPTNGYASFSGTSMASPHVAGAIALLWEAAPGLAGDIPATRALLDGTAIDVDNTTCGGTAANNNVFGEGRLDVLAAYNQAPVGPTGTLTGTVTATGGVPIEGATVVAEGSITRTVTTNAAGVYSMTLSVGTYTVSASKFGHVTQSTSASITDSGTTTRNFALPTAPTGVLTGIVRDDMNRRLGGATVTLVGTPLASATTDAFGIYTLASVPNGTYTAELKRGNCYTTASVSVTTSGASTTRNFVLTSRSDTFGYTCSLPTLPYEEATTVLPITGDDVAGSVSLPFAFPFYGGSYTTATICTNGIVTFTTIVCNTSSAWTNRSIPDATQPNLAIYPFWDDLNVDAGTATIRGETKGMAPNRRYVIEFRNVRFFNDTARVHFNVVLYEDGRIATQYKNVGGSGRQQGDSATLGIENLAGNDGLQYSFNEAVTSSGMSILYRPPGMPEALMALDFGGTGRSYVSAFRPTTRQWLVHSMPTVTWGLAGDIPVPGDYDGNGTTDIAVFRPSNGQWWVRGSSAVAWGLANDIPVPGDYTGNGQTDFAVYRPSNGTWWVQGMGVVAWGLSGDIPVPGDYNGDGKTDIAIFRPSNSSWWIRGIGTKFWGTTGDVPVAADYNGDGTTQMAVFRPSDRSWWIDGMPVRNWGLSGDIPAPADYDGDGATDIAVFRPSNATWYVRGGSVVALGASTDRVLALPDAVRRVYYP
jgi:subtilisin family serine protease